MSPTVSTNDVSFIPWIFYAQKGLGFRIQFLCATPYIQLSMNTSLILVYSIGQKIARRNYQANAIHPATLEVGDFLLDKVKAKLNYLKLNYLN